MTTLRLVTLPAETETPAPRQSLRRHRLRKPWSYGRAYVVIAAIAPLVLLGLLLMHLHNLGHQWSGQLRQLIKTH
ncbi:MAG TPA: hypothetical protein V6D06_02760 [Trichocoleus sp.]